MLEFDLEELRSLAQGEAFACYLRKGRVPAELKKLIDLTTKISAYLKENPYWDRQPRVPAGDPNGGQWTEGGGGGGNRTPRYQSPSSSDPNEIYDPPLESVYPELLIIPFLRVPRIISAFYRFIESGRRNADWKWGMFKSSKKWGNQMERRNWTPQEITHTIKTGTNYRVQNWVNPGNIAKQYTDPKTGKFVVRDENTKELLQISGENFEPNKPWK